MFYFVRHGNADYSECDQKIYQGFGENFVSLSEEGKQQAEQAAGDERLRGADVILCSPYTRALHTAAILSRKLNVPIAVETDLHEWLANKAYVYEDGKTAERAFAEYMAGNGSYPEGEEKDWEDAERVRNRVVGVLKKYAGLNKVIVVGHGVMIQATTGAAHPEHGEIVAFELA